MGNIEIPHDTGTQFPMPGGIQKSRNNENEVEAPQSLPILEYLVLADQGILANQNFLIAQEQSVAQIDEADKTKELLRAIGRNVPQSENEKN